MRWRRKDRDDRTAHDPAPGGARGQWFEGETVEFIPDAGACLVSKRVLEGVGRARFMVREHSKAPADNGWIVFSEFDDDAYVADMAANFEIVDFNRVCTIEPAILGLWAHPVGTDVELVLDGGGRRYFVDATTGRRIPTDELWPPRPPGA